MPLVSGALDAPRSSTENLDAAPLSKLDLPLAILIAMEICFLALIVTKAIDWPYADDFVYIDWLQEFRDGKPIWQFWMDAHVASHPLGTQAIFAIYVFRILGLHFSYLIYASALAIIASQLLIYQAFRQSSAAKRILVVIVTSIAFFHPIQSKHIFWAFELGWYFVNLFMILNVILVEKKYRLSWLFAIASCILASFSSAQGVFTWAALALHVFLVPSFGRRWLTIAVSLIGLLLSIAHLKYLSTYFDNANTSVSLEIYIPYVIKLLGSAFANRSDIVTLTLGGGMICVMFLLGFAMWRARPLTPNLRIGGVLIVGSVLCLAAFAVGRADFGFSWVASHFHVGPMLVPLILGISLVCVELLFLPRIGIWLKLPILASLLFVCSSFIPAFQFGQVEVREGVEERQVAKWSLCDGRFPETVSASLNLSIQHIDLYRRTVPFIKQLCTGTIDERTRRIFEFPALFESMATEKPDARPALIDLWTAYIVHGDLRHAFSIDDSDYAKKLLSFATANARSGSKYDSDLLAPHSAYFLEVGKE
ncbi:hypothetical protein [Rhizobium sp. HT1-10]|uniref:hypothetical protein n=1 Tax=Rhizobium sp. HT1-10 TaxID=3111638 RepID=UPI003C18A17F